MGRDLYKTDPSFITVYSIRPRGCETCPFSYTCPKDGYIDIITPNGTIAKQAPRLVRPRTQSASSLFSAMELPNCHLEVLCGNEDSFKFS